MYNICIRMLQKVISRTIEEGLYSGIYRNSARSGALNTHSRSRALARRQQQKGNESLRSVSCRSLILAQNILAILQLKFNVMFLQYTWDIIFNVAGMFCAERFWVTFHLSYDKSSVLIGHNIEKFSSLEILYSVTNQHAWKICRTTSETVSFRNT